MKIVFGPTLLLIAGPRVIDAFAPPQSPLIASRSSNVGVSVNREQSKPIYMVKYEDLVEKMPTETVIDAVEKAPSGKVIASDVAASAGVSLSQARRDLTALASLTKGDIAVSNDGELMYTFPSGLRGVLSSNSAKYKAIAQYEKVKPVLFYLVRVSFGVVLLTSLVAIFSTIFFINSSSSSDDDRRRDDRGGGGMGFGGSYFWGPSPLDFFYYRPYYGYYSPMPGEAYRDPEEMGFLESTFSYIFGDGNPNQNIEEKRLSLVASMIRINNGAVTAEQLAPFCDDVPEVSNDDSTYVDEVSQNIDMSLVFCARYKLTQF